MGLFDFLKPVNIDQELDEYKASKGGILLDVREVYEYREGHIPGSKNLPLQSISRAASLISNKNTPIFVYCYSGSRSRQAVNMLSSMGYTNVKNIGGITHYSGKVEK